MEIVEARVPVGGMANQSSTRGAREGKEQEKEKEKEEGVDDEEVEKAEVKAAVSKEGWVGVGRRQSVATYYTHRGRWQQDVCEVSLLPRRWQERGKPDVTYAASSGHCAAA